MSFLPRPPASAALVADLARIVGSRRVSTLDGDRLIYSRDAWARDLIRVRGGQFPCAPSCVVWPGSAAETARVLALAERLAVPVVPFGAGSGVAGGARPMEGGIALDVKRMSAIRQLDAESLRVEVEAGIVGQRLERRLNGHGLTLGHFPSSIGCSTLGGWLAARSAGQMSTLYGKIEDMTLGLEVATPGHVRRLDRGPRGALDGLDINRLVIGSEGTLGVITAAELRVRPIPARRSFRGYRFPSVEAGVEAIRRILRMNIKPSVVRLYDALDTLVGRSHGRDSDETESLEARSLEGLGRARQIMASEVASRFPNLAKTRLKAAVVKTAVRAAFGSPALLNRALEFLREECLLILGFEGPPAIVAVESAHAQEVCLGCEGDDLGAEAGEHWFKNRYNVSFKQSKLYTSGLFVDTMEVAATWDRLLPVYRSVRRAIAKDAFVMAHFSHAYPEGCSIYFTFTGPAMGQSDVEAATERYDRIWKNAMTAVHEAGGTISHHHGVGMLKASGMLREHGPGGMKILNCLKDAFDPAGVLNPGKLGLSTTTPRSSGERTVPVDVARRMREFPREIASTVGEGNIRRVHGRVSIRPPDEGSLAALMRVATARSVPIATDQTGFRVPAGACRVDLSRFEGVARISLHSLFVDVEAGMPVERVESLLAAHGATLGRLHPRAYRRSVGAALARNLLVRRGPFFGDLHDVCFGLRGLLAHGVAFETRAVPRSATGPDLNGVALGAGGRFSVITKATLRIAVRPPKQREVAYRFPSPHAALDAARNVLQRGVRPIAGRVLWDDASFVVELGGASDELLQAQLAILASSAANAKGEKAELSRKADGGRFDAVVECAARWSRVSAVVEAVSGCREGAVWIDFMTAEEATIVSTVTTREGRHRMIQAGVEAGGTVVAGTRRSEEAEGAFDERAFDARHVDAHQADAHQVDAHQVDAHQVDAHRVDAPHAEAYHMDTYRDVEDRLSLALDPSGVFRGRR
ncbi:MAG: FAD-binding oxidoreductase [Deltaproteobacteria bacterium]|nr:FAD-binding oxidoreductase [Deltaproteobacteria bacterium]